MSDLSGILGDVYGEDPDDNNNGNGASAAPAPPAQPAPPPRAPQAEAPGWADEEVLDEAFAEWKPGPPEGAPDAEREVFAPDPSAMDDDLAAALSAALADVNDKGGPDDQPSPYAPPAAAAPPAGDDGWVTVTDDDGFGLPTPPAAAPVAPASVAPAGDWGMATDAPIVTPRGWSRSADDILPSGSGKPAKQPRAAKASKAAKDQEKAAPPADAQWGQAPAGDAAPPAEAPAKRRGLKLRRG
ncbi:MAG TPA: hypothetical protein VM030_07925 [Acidimicrobiales bacterium]|nr:hypothetical protein [Acidimicrobiales bacterium]